MLDAQLPVVGREHIATERAKEALSRTHDYDAATELLESWCREDTELWMAITEPCLEGACRFQVRQTCHHMRDTSWTAPNYTIGGHGERVLREGERLLDFPLIGTGKLLRDATAKDIETAIALYRKLSDDMRFKAAWLTAISAKIGKKKVGSVLSERDLVELKEGVSRE